MTRQPPRPFDPQQYAAERAARAAYTAKVKNVTGLVLLLVAFIGLGVTAWLAHPLLLATFAAACTAAVGYLLATAEPKVRE